MQQVRVLLVQLASLGDCLFVTAIARQIKEIDFPGCHLTWIIGSKYKAAVENNPYVDAVIEIPISSRNDITTQRNLIKEHIANAGGYNKFDQIFVTDYTELNSKNWFGTTRSSLFRSYPHQLKVNPQPLIYLTDGEKLSVEKFCRENKIDKFSYNVLFECSPQSGQSLMTFNKAKQLAAQIVSNHKNIKFILSSNQPFTSDNSNIIDGSVISWRENAELANYCNLMMGCSSGISWLCTSQWTKPLPFIQIVNPMYMKGDFSASMKIDFRYFGIDTKNLVELYNPPEDILAECIISASKNYFQIIKEKYDVTDNSYFSNYKFLNEARISFYEKIKLFIASLLPAFFINGFGRIKRGWVTRGALWLKRKIFIHKKLF